MAKLRVVLAVAVALFCQLIAAKSLLAPVTISDSDDVSATTLLSTPKTSSEVVPSGNTPPMTPSNRLRPTASSVPAPVLNTNTFEDLAGNMTSFALQDMISYFTGTKDTINSNFTLFVGSSQQDNSSSSAAKVIATEKFAKALSNAKCTEHSVMFSFADKNRYNEARKEWKWINDVGERHVYLVTKNQECDKGADDPDDVQLWDIVEARFNNMAKSVTMMGSPVEFVDVFREWKLRASNTGIMGGKKVKNGSGGGVGTDVQGRDIESQGQINFDYQIDPKFGFAFGSSPLRLLEPTDPDSAMVGAVFCETCSIYGTFDWEFDIGTGSVSISDINPLKGVISLTARGVGATIQPKLELYEGTDVFDHEIEIYGKAIPRSGIYKKSLFDVGATVHLLFRIKLDKTPDPMALTAGFNISLADEAVFKIDLENPENSVVEGWKPSIDSLEPEVSSNVSMNANIGPRIMLSYGAQVVGQGARVGIVFAGGNLEVDVKTDVKSGCSRKSAFRGLSLEGGLLNEVAAFAEATMGKTVGATTTLASTSTQLFSTCKTMDASLLGARHRPTQLNEHFTPEIMAKASSVKDKITDGAKSVATVVTSAVGSVASEAKESITSVAGEVKTEASEAVVAATSIAGEVKDGIADAAESVANWFDD